jgi:hypothetical protein
MSTHSIGTMLFRSVRALLIALLKVLALASAWLCKIAGILLTRIGEAIEKVIARQS